MGKTQNRKQQGIIPPGDRKDTQKRKDAMLKALEKSLGVVKTACDAMNPKLSRNTFYEWYNGDPEFRKAVDQMSEVALDFVESKLFERIKRGNPIAAIFYLKTKGKKRGYIERMEHSGKDGTPLFSEVKVTIVHTNNEPGKGNT